MRRLRPGDRVAVVAPGFAVRREALDSGLAALRKLGYEPVPGAHVRDRSGYFAGSDDARASDLNSALRDPSVRAVWFARGGYGAARLLDRLDWQAFRRDPKLLIGYSDATAIFSAAWNRFRAPSLYAPNVAELGDRSAWERGSLLAALGGESVSLEFKPSGVLAPGKARGPLLGGTLTVLVHLLATKAAPSFRGAIVLLEDVGEEVYRLDRLLTHLLSTGALSRSAGIVLGALDPPPTRRAFPPDVPLRRMLRERLGSLGVPVVMGLPVGHRRRKRSVPLGTVASLDTGRGRLVVDPPYRTP